MSVFCEVVNVCILCSCECLYSDFTVCATRGSLLEDPNVGYLLNIKQRGRSVTSHSLKALW